MKCKYCGAEIKPGSRFCEYCDSEVEREKPENKTVIRETSKPNSIPKVIVRAIVSLAGIWAVLIVITLVVVLNSDAFKNIDSYSDGAGTLREMPKNEVDLKGQVITCDKNGDASIIYQGDTYENIKILDSELLEWLSDTKRSIDSVEICFSTDDNGDISDIGLLSADFFVMEREGTDYIAVREGDVICFSSEIPLETGRYYGGYFSYPNLRLYQGEETKSLEMTYMDPKCDDKESRMEQEYYTAEEITVYRVSVEGKWYYCSKETYDAISIGDMLNEYRISGDAVLSL